MITIFRKIRYKLLKNKTEAKAGKTANSTLRAGRYLKYAIGEIFLVVIGILIALQINNWNEQRKDRVKEQILLNQLQEDFRANLVQLEEKMATREKIINSAVALLKAFDFPERANRDSVIKTIAIIGNDPTFDPIKNDLNSSDNIRLISNIKLSRMLSNWSSDVVAIKEIEDAWSNIIYNQFDHLASELGIGRDLSNSFMNEQEHLWLLDKNSKAYKIPIGRSKLGAGLDEILTSKKLETVIGNAITINKSANLQSEAVRSRIKELLEIIKEELGK
jgi:hypothetical protein